MVISIDAGKKIDIIQHSFIILKILFIKLDNTIPPIW